MEKTKEIKDYLNYLKKVQVLKYAKERGKNKEAYEFFGIKKSTFYKWKKEYEKQGEKGLLRKKPLAYNFPNQIKPEIVEKVLELRQEHKLGTWRIKWYLERYHDIIISECSVYRILKRNKVERLDRKTTRRSMHSIRYEKQTPGHHVQVDVKFLIFINEGGIKIKRYQYTAIDDATRIRTLKIYEKHTQESSIDFINCVVEKFPFRINTIQTDNGHEFQSKFHWHVQDLGMKHRFIKVGTPQLNGKVERSHLTDKKEFYQLLSYIDDVDLNQKLQQWENFYNFNRPHGSFKGKTPYEILKAKLK
ncbi:IS481 family transposase [Chryseobacterium sp. G0201]|uniref:IS481 family transposase n=1 Tax=Chryseobacterium sp. G0201 TaxID=2487065 RepID=UPI000F4D810C|nr:IS481 family transposase [Chryseobacterium sp. G0201]AZA53934.1 IS481 family transposase [Chryseobacterium sp. G0201]